MVCSKIGLQLSEPILWNWGCCANSGVLGQWTFGRVVQYSSGMYTRTLGLYSLGSGDEQQLGGLYDISLYIEVTISNLCFALQSNMERRD